MNEIYLQDELFTTDKSVYETKELSGLDGSVGCAFDWRPEVAGSAAAEFGNILSWRLIMKYFLRSFSLFR